VISNLFTLSTYCYFQVVRQDERQCVEAVNQLCNGDPSAETEAFLKSLERPLPITSKFHSTSHSNTLLLIKEKYVHKHNSRRASQGKITLKF
jgi:hypothetical protein